MNLAIPQHYGANDARPRGWQRYVPFAAASLLLHAWALWVWCARVVVAHPMPAEMPVRITIAAVLPGGGRPESAAAKPQPAPIPEAREDSVPAAVPPPPPQKPNQARPLGARRTQRRPAPVPVPPPLAARVDEPGAAAGSPARAAQESDTSAAGTGMSGPTGRGDGHGRGDGEQDLGNARAYCLSCPAPAYPMIARQRNWSGAVAVWLEVDREGSVRQAHVERSSGYEVLDHEALAAARRSRFRVPATTSGRVAGIIEYRFELVE